MTPTFPPRRLSDLIMVEPVHRETAAAADQKLVGPVRTRRIEAHEDGDAVAAFAGDGIDQRPAAVRRQSRLVARIAVPDRTFVRLDRNRAARSRPLVRERREIGRASWRERVCQYV